MRTSALRGFSAQARSAKSLKCNIETLPYTAILEMFGIVERARAPRALASDTDSHSDQRRSLSDCNSDAPHVSVLAAASGSALTLPCLFGLRLAAYVLKPGMKTMY